MPQHPCPWRVTLCPSVPHWSLEAATSAKGSLCFPAPRFHFQRLWASPGILRHSMVGNDSIQSKWSTGWLWWHAPVIPVPVETEGGRSQVQGQPWQHSSYPHRALLETSRLSFPPLSRSWAGSSRVSRGTLGDGVVCHLSLTMHLWVDSEPCLSSGAPHDHA